MTEADALLFVNGTYIKSHSIMAEDEMVFGQILTTPYSTNLNITFMDASGRTEVIQIDVGEGTPIITGAEWFEKMDFITSVCADTTQCGGYVNRWMGTGNPFYERAAEYFKGHFEGLGYGDTLAQSNWSR